MRIIRTALEIFIQLVIIYNLIRISPLKTPKKSDTTGSNLFNFTFLVKVRGVKFFSHDIENYSRYEVFLLKEQYAFIHLRKYVLKSPITISIQKVKNNSLLFSLEEIKFLPEFPLEQFEYKYVIVFYMTQQGLYSISMYFDTSKHLRNVLHK